MNRLESTVRCLSGTPGTPGVRAMRTSADAPSDACFEKLNLWAGCGGHCPDSWSPRAPVSRPVAVQLLARASTCTSVQVNYSPVTHYRVAARGSGYRKRESYVRIAVGSRVYPLYAASTRGTHILGGLPNECPQTTLARGVSAGAIVAARVRFLKPPQQIALQVSKPPSSVLSATH